MQVRTTSGAAVSTTLLAAIALLTCAAPAAAQGIDYVQAHYTKYEYRIPMRDGKRLFTAVYVPKDASRDYPILLTRTPYSVRPYGVDQDRSSLGPSSLFARAGYIFAYQDVRGRWMSEGTFVNMRPQLPADAGPHAIDESTDTYDTIDWLVKHVPGHNGKVGMWGVSYRGFYTVAGIINAHPALKAASPQAPINDWFMGDDWHHNGALFLPHMFNFMAKFGYPRPEPTKKFDHPFDHETPDGYQFFLRLGPLSHANAKYFKGKVSFWNDAMRHGNYDTFWQARNIRPHLRNIRPAVMTVGGWFDAENLFGALETYRRIEANSPHATNTLVMGPWRHGQWTGGSGQSLGHIAFHAKTAEFYREKIEFPFFQFYLKGETPKQATAAAETHAAQTNSTRSDANTKGAPFAQPEAWVFETGTNQWRQFDHWPPKAARPKSLYFQAEGRLGWSPASATTARRPFDQYVSDPAKPVPFIDWVDTGMPPEYMVADQRFAARRPDVLVYQTGVLEHDVRIAGPVAVELDVSTSGTDSDWIVKLIDVYPDDYQDPPENPQGVRMGGFEQLIRGDVMRGKFRNSFTQPEPFEPDKPTHVHFTLPDTYHAFRSGHRIMVQIQSSWFPLVDRNPQKFVDIYRATAADYQPATERVYRDPARPSHLTVRVLP